MNYCEFMHTLERSCWSGQATMTGTSNFQRHVWIKLGILFCCIWKIPIYLMTIFKMHFIFDNFIHVQSTMYMLHTQIIICMWKFHGYSLSFRNVHQLTREKEGDRERDSSCLVCGHCVKLNNCLKSDNNPWNCKSNFCVQNAAEWTWALSTSTRTQPTSQ